MDSNKEQHLIPTSAWHPRMKDSEIKSFPLINEPMASFADSGVIIHPFGIPPPVDYSILWTYFKYTPEMVAVIRAIVEDIMSDGWILEGGRNNKLKTEKFLMENFAKEQISSLLFDAMVTGDGYLFLQKLSKPDVREAIDRTFNKPEIKSLIPDQFKSELGARLFTEIEEDEDIFTPRKFVSVPSSTLRANFDKNGNLIDWIQKVGIRTEHFSAENMIHFRLLRLDGKFYGYSPLVSILKEMDILANVKDFARYYFEKGGVPNFLFILENETPKSENFKQFKKAIQLYSSLANKYKSMVVTGKVQVEALNRMGKDMEFRELARYLTQVLIMTWGVPVARLTDAGLGDKGGGLRGSTISTEGYYRKISHIQDLLEDLLNTQLLSPFKVVMRFKKTYLQDEIREVQVDKVKTDTVEQRLRLGLLSREQAALYLGLDPDELPSDKEWKEMANMLPNQQRWGSGLQNQSQMNKFQTLSESSEKIGEASDKQGIALQKKSMTIIKRLDNETYKIIEGEDDYGD